MGTSQIELSKEEAELYDRQIRLWGVEAQQKLRKSRVLVVGLNSIGNEVCKNIVLAGISHLTMTDHTPVTEINYQRQLLVDPESLGENTAEACYKNLQELNPNVDIIVDKEHINTKDRNYFSKYDVVCMFGCCSEVLVSISEMCHSLGIKFICGDVFGYFAYMFSDLGKHKFVKELPKQKKKTIDGGPSASKIKKNDVEDDDKEMVVEEQTFCTLSEALTHPLFENKSLKEAKKISKAYLVMQVFHAYHDEYCEYPREVTSLEQLEKLKTVRDNVFEQMGIDNCLLEDDMLYHSFGYIYPINAILGGVIAQEIIKIVSEKDEPHNNFFFYDGIETSGVVEYIGPSHAHGDEKKVGTKCEEIVL